MRNLPTAPGDTDVKARGTVGRSAPLITLSLCFAMALLEGLDLQSMGVAAPRLAAEFGMTSAQVGFAFSAGTLGLLPGAILGGRLADSIGRKRVLIVCAFIFGLLSLATAIVSDYNQLLVARLLTGIGLGGALPILIAMSAEAVRAEARNTAVSVMYCGVPFGGVLASLVGLLNAGGQEWRHVFYTGGVGPLVLIPLLIAFLPESPPPQFSGSTVRSRPIKKVLFSGGRAASTVQLWLSYFCTLIVLYFLLNWLPTLMSSRHFPVKEIGLIQILFNVGGGIGALLIGPFMDNFRKSVVISLVYIGIIVALAFLAVSQTRLTLSLAGFFAGVFVIGAQSVLYSLSAALYPTAMRGSGVGMAVAVGRLGSVIGPLVAGLLLSSGSGTTAVIGASIPVTFAAAVAALLLVRHLGKI